MASIEERFTALERDMAEMRLKVEALEEDVRSIPELIRAGFQLQDQRMAALDGRMEVLRAELRGEFRSELDKVRREFSEELAQTRDHLTARMDLLRETLLKEIAKQIASLRQGG